MNINKNYIKLYLDYLDKEMTIMGILSTFCIASLGISIDRLVFYHSKPSAFVYWNQVNLYCILAMTGLLIAALFFYRQRSSLAYFHGQISLSLTKDDDDSIESHLNEVDGWSMWNYYKAAWWALIIAFSQFGLMLLSEKFSFTRDHQLLLAPSIILLISLRSGIIIYACSKYWDWEDPFKALYSKKYRKNKELSKAIKKPN
jgi:purine-cytosine permease-like protein